MVGTTLFYIIYEFNYVIVSIIDLGYKAGKGPRLPSSFIP